MREQIGARVTALATVTALVFGGGVVTAVYRHTTGRPDPAQVVPSNAIAVATIDFGLAADQEHAIEQMLSRFSEVKLPTGDSLKDRVFRALTQDATPPVDYDKDVKPWLGDRIVVAGWLDHGTPRPEIAMESRDDDAFRKHAEAAFAPDGHYRVQDGFVILSDSEADVKTVAAAAARSSLASAQTYMNDMARLPAGEAIKGWVDGPAAVPLLSSFVSPSDRADAALGFQLFGALSVGDLFKRHFAFGAHFSGDAVRIDLRDIDHGPRGTASTSMLRSLPAGTVAAVELGNPPQFTDDLMRFVQTLGPLMGGKEPLPASPSDLFQRALGIKLPDDVKTILGDRAVVAFGGLNVVGPPDIAIRTHPRDTEKATALGDALASNLRSEGALDVNVSTAGDDVVLASSPAYGEEIGKAGSLGEKALVAAALGDVPDAITTAGYVDLARILPLFATNLPPDAQHLRAAGYWVADDGNLQSAQLSVVIN